MVPRCADDIICRRQKLILRACAVWCVETQTGTQIPVWILILPRGHTQESEAITHFTSLRHNFLKFSMTIIQPVSLSIVRRPKWDECYKTLGPWPGTQNWSRRLFTVWHIPSAPPVSTKERKCSQPPFTAWEAKGKHQSHHCCSLFTPLSSFPGRMSSSAEENRVTWAP